MRILKTWINPEILWEKDIENVYLREEKIDIAVLLVTLSKIIRRRKINI